MAKFLCACFVSFVEPTFFRWIWFLREYFLKGYLDNLCRVICVWIVIMHFLTSGGWQEVKCVYCKVPVGFRSYMRLYPGKLCIWNLWSDDSYLPESGKRPWERVCGKISDFIFYRYQRNAQLSRRVWDWGNGTIVLRKAIWEKKNFAKDAKIPRLSPKYWKTNSAVAKL